MIKETIQAVEDAEAKASELVSQMHRKGGKKQL